MKLMPCVERFFEARPRLVRLDARRRRSATTQARFPRLRGRCRQACDISLSLCSSARRPNSWARPRSHISKSAGARIAYRLRRGIVPTLVFLPGYASDMEGAKALALDAFAERRGLAMLRFDYSGTGSSGGRFEDGTLALWLEEALARDRPADERPADPRRLIDGRLARAPSGPASARARAGAGRDRRRAGLHQWGFARWCRRRAAGASTLRLLGIWAAAAPARQRDRDRLPGAPAPRRARRGGAARHRVPDHARAPFSRCPAECAQGRRSPPVGAARDRRDPAHRRRRCWSLPLDPCSSPPRSPPPPRRLPRCRHARRARLPRARGAEGRRQSRLPRKPSRKRRRPRATRTRRPRGCMPRPAICGSRPTSRARRRSTSTGRWRCPGSRPSSAAKPCSTAPAPPRRRTTSRPRGAQADEAGNDDLRRPLLLVFLRRARDPRRRSRERRQRRSARR